MQLLLAVVPYFAAILVYWQASFYLFGSSPGKTPSNWSWRLMLPVLVGGLTPLALAAKSGLGGVERGWLLSVPAVCILFAIFCMGFLRAEKYFWAQERVRVLRRWGDVAKWQVFVLGGSLVLVYGATVNVIVASEEGETCQPAEARLRPDSRSPAVVIELSWCRSDDSGPVHPAAR